MNDNNIQVWRLSTAQANFQLGPIAVEPMGNQLRGPSGDCTIGPRAMDVLVQLAADSAPVVSREELNEKVWGGRSVVDEALSRCISELRHAIDNCGGKPSLIKTVRGRGYQLSIQPVFWSGTEADHSPGEPAKADKNIKASRVLVIGVLILAGVFYLYRWVIPGINLSNLPPSLLPTISVGGIENLTGDSGRDMYAQALAHELEARLAGSRDIIVLAQQKNSPTTPAGLSLPAFSAQPRADYLISGSVSLRGDGAAALALKLNGPGNQLLGGDVLDIQEGTDRDRTMSKAVNTVREALGLPAVSLPACRWSGSSEAMDLYFRGRAAVQARRRDNLERGVKLFQQALALDPVFGQALAAMSVAYELLPSYIGDDDPDALNKANALYPPLAKATAEKALAVCDSLGEAWYVLRHAPDYKGENVWLRNRYSIQHAVALEPNNDDLLRFYADYLEMAGKLQEAGEQFERAWIINPANARTLNNYAMYLADAGEYERALELDTIGRNIQGYNAPFVRTNVAIHQQDWPAAREAVLEGETNLPPMAINTILAVFDALESPEKAPEARNAVRQLYESGIPGAINFLIFFGSLLEDTDYIYSALERDPEQPWMPGFWAPAARSLRIDPRFNNVFKHNGMLEYWQVFGPPDNCELIADELRCRG